MASVGRPLLKGDAMWYTLLITLAFVVVGAFIKTILDWYFFKKENKGNDGNP